MLLSRNPRSPCRHPVGPTCRQTTDRDQDVDRGRIDKQSRCASGGRAGLASAAAGGGRPGAARRVAHKAEERYLDALAGVELETTLEEVVQRLAQRRPW